MARQYVFSVVLVLRVIGVHNGTATLARYALYERIGEKFALGVDNIRLPIDQRINEAVVRVQRSTQVGIHRVKWNRTHVIHVILLICTERGRQRQQLDVTAVPFQLSFQQQYGDNHAIHGLRI